MALFKDLKDKNNNNWGIKRIKSELNKNGYEVTQVRKTIKGKRDRYYTITLKNE